MSHRVLVVEDSHALNELLCDALTHVGYEVHGLYDAETVLEYGDLKDVQIMVLDIQLPGESGLALAQRLRPLMPDLGILMLTTSTSNNNRIEGYEAGADYYLPKPVSPDEIVSAVDSLVRRKQQGRQEDSRTPRCVLSRSNLTLTSDERSVRLSVGDTTILVALAGAPNKQLEHWQILSLLEVDHDKKVRSALDVRMFRLRTKLSEVTGQDYPIVSIRGVGYRLGFDLEIV